MLTSKVIADIPPSADTFGVDERRLLADVGAATGAERIEMERQLDDLRYRRLRRPDAPRVGPPQPILERAATMTRPIVILGDPGSGKSTLLQLMSLRAARDGLRIIAVTGYGQPEDRERARVAGIDHLLIKPVDCADLARLLT